jgi:hypothetical protein
MISKPQDANSSLYQKSVTPLISRASLRKTMSGAVQLDSQRCGRAEKVQKIRRQGVLPPKPKASKTPIPQDAPESLFGITCFFP